MTADQFRDSPELTGNFQKAIQTQELSLALQIMDDEAPIHELQDDTSEVAALVAYGFEKGYAAYGKKLKEFAERRQPTVTLKPDYSSP